MARDRSEPGKYLLLDGHLRIEVLKDMGETEVVCLISTDDEAFTYNKRVNRIAIIQEHRMILKAIERGVSEERIAKVLNVDVASIKRKRRLWTEYAPRLQKFSRTSTSRSMRSWSSRKWRHCGKSRPPNLWSR